MLFIIKINSKFILKSSSLIRRWIDRSKLRHLSASSSSTEISPQTPQQSDKEICKHTKEELALFPEFAQFIVPPVTKEWTDEELRSKERAIQKDQWTAVYRNQGMLKIFMVLRINMVAMIAIYGLFMYKVSYSLYQTGTVELLEIYREFLLLLWATLMNYLIKRYMTRVVGVISVDTETRSIYRVSTFTINASRHNDFVRRGDFWTVVDSNEGTIDKYAKLRWTFKPKDQYLIIPTGQCHVVDERAAFELLGNLKPFEGVKIPVPIEMLPGGLDLIEATKERRERGIQSDTETLKLPGQKITADENTIEIRTDIKSTNS